jgi:hypothetical protein
MAQMAEQVDMLDRRLLVSGLTLYSTERGQWRKRTIQVEAMVSVQARVAQLHGDLILWLYGFVEASDEGRASNRDPDIA